jgi:hypothetical protein
LSFMKIEMLNQSGLQNLSCLSLLYDLFPQCCSSPRTKQILTTIVGNML